MKRLLLCFIVLCFICKQSNCQVVLDTGDLFIEISSIISAMPGDSGNDYLIPDSVIYININTAFIIFYI